MLKSEPPTRLSNNTGIDKASSRDSETLRRGVDEVCLVSDPAEAPKDVRQDIERGETRLDSEYVGDDYEARRGKDEEVVGVCSDEDDDSEPASGSDSDSDSEAAEEEGERKGRGWSERRARLRKDGMHGRRLPPPEAHEERVIAKAAKKEVGISFGLQKESVSI